MDISPIKSPEEVKKLLQDLWLNHKAGINPPGNKIFLVSLPPIDKDKKEKIKF